MKKCLGSFIVCLAAILLFSACKHDKRLIHIPLPANISDAGEEFSGMAIWNNRVYLLPQYGDHRKIDMKDDFFVYSLSADSIGLVIDGKLPALRKYRKIKVNNLDSLPAAVKIQYEGFEAIAIVNGSVYLSMETHDYYDSCYLFKGVLDTATNEIRIDMNRIIALRRQFKHDNAGFESLAYLPSANKLLALYEANFKDTIHKGYLVDTSFTEQPVLTDIAPAYLRITDIAVADKIYAINYYWPGDYDGYASYHEAGIAKDIPDLGAKMKHDSNYLKKAGNDYARIIYLDSLHDKNWKQLASFDAPKNNWEGLVRFRKGVLVISDANRNVEQQLTTFAYLPLFE